MLTVRVEPVVTPRVPEVVIVPPERPLAVAIDVTVPPALSSAAQYTAVPLECSTCPAVPNVPLALIAPVNVTVLLNECVLVQAYCRDVLTAVTDPCQATI